MKFNHRQGWVLRNSWKYYCRPGYWGPRPCVQDMTLCQSNKDWVHQMKTLHCFRQILLSSVSDIIIKMCSVLLSEVPSGEGAVLIFGLHSPLILMEIIHLCSGASTWSLGFGSPSPKKRSGEKAYEVCKTQQWFRTCTKNVISNGSPRDHHQRMWRFKLTLTHEAPMRVGETWKSRGDAFWGQLPSPLGSTTLVFTWKKVWNLSDSWLPPCMVFNTCDLGLVWFFITLHTNFYFIHLSSQLNTLGS